MSENKDREFIEIDSDKLIPIKATPLSARALANKMIQEKTDQLNDKHQNRKNPSQFKTDDEYLKHVVRPKTRLSDGTIVVGDLSEEEKTAFRTDNDALVRKHMRLRQKAMEIMKKRRLEGKSQRDYFEGYTSYEALSKRQGQLPQSPHKDRDQYLEE